VSREGPYVHLEWGPEDGAGQEETDEHELWLQMNFRGLFPIAFRAGGGDDFTAKPNFLCQHVDFWVNEVDHFNSRVEYSWERIWNQAVTSVDLTLGNIFPGPTAGGRTADFNFSRYQFFGQDVHPWRFEKNLFNRRLSPAIETGLNILPIAADLNPEGDYGVMYYCNFVRRFSTIAL
jgi:hypothetical protein